MAIIHSYQVRAGRPMPILCDTTGATQEVLTFTFGTECQKIYNCSVDEKVIESSEACLQNPDEDAVFSASYRAFPTKVQGKIVYNSTVKEIPSLHNDYDTSGECVLSRCPFDT
jgi:hypothetical protein